MVVAAPPTLFLQGLAYTNALSRDVAIFDEMVPSSGEGHHSPDTYHIGDRGSLRVMGEALGWGRRGWHRHHRPRRQRHLRAFGPRLRESLVPAGAAIGGGPDPRRRRRAGRPLRAART